MSEKVAKKLRKIAREIAHPDAPYEEFESKNVNQIIPSNWKEFQQFQHYYYLL